MTYRVRVGVALRRPPRLDEYRLVLVEARSPFEALLIAAQISACTCVMPVSTDLLDADGNRRTWRVPWHV